MEYIKGNLSKLLREDEVRYEPKYHNKTDKNNVQDVYKVVAKATKEQTSVIHIFQTTCSMLVNGEYFRKKYAC